MDDEKILFLVLLFFRLLGLLHGIVSTPFDLSLSIVVVYFVKLGPRKKAEVEDRQIGSEKNNTIF